MLDVDSLSFGYSEKLVLKDVSFRMAAGETWCLLGGNGVGKTTLLKCLLGVETPAGGTATLDGIGLDARAVRDRARQIAYVPQRNAACDLSVYDFMLMGRRPHGGWRPTRDDHGMVAETIVTLGLESLAPRRVSSLSGGESRKVGIGRALVQKPRLLLLDEPTSDLDLKNQIEVMTLVSGVARNGKLAVLIAMHDLNLALRFADQFMFMNDGAVVVYEAAEAITPRVIRDAYGIDAKVGSVGGHKVVVPVAFSEREVAACAN